jgi:hypothetical protein
MEPSPEIENLVHAWFDAATRGDTSLIVGWAATKLTISVPDGRCIRPVGRR